MRATPILAALAIPLLAGAAPASRHNVLLFVADGLRAGSVDPASTPAIAALAARGTWFANSHSLYPTFTTPNASAMATGHRLGDTGDFGNTILIGAPEPFAHGSVTPFLENDQVLGDIDDRFLSPADNVPAGYLNEATVLAAARAAGLSTAAIGKLGPVAIQDHANSALVSPAHRDARGTPTLLIDDRTGSPEGIPLPAEIASAISAAGLPAKAPGRGANGQAGDAATPGTKVANTVQQDWFTDVTTRVVLPRFKAAGHPFALVFWSRDPDGTQHNQGDSLGRFVPGINGSTSRAAVVNADRDLAHLLEALSRLGLLADTDVIVASDHGFSTIAKTIGAEGAPSATSHAAHQRILGAKGPEVPEGFLPPGFLAIDLAHALGLPLHDPDSRGALVDPSQPPAADGSRRARPLAGNGLIGEDPSHPAVVVAANGGSDLVYLPDRARAAALAPRVVASLLAQDTVSGVFVDETLGHFAGTLPLASIDLQGKALTPVPAIAVNFRSWSMRGHGCELPDTMCTVEVADTPLQQGQGMHGSFSRADTANVMAAAGPDFRAGFRDELPTSNADLGRTLAAILTLDIRPNGTLLGRVLTEAMPGGASPGPATRRRLVSEPAPGGLRTVLEEQSVGGTRYFDAAGFPGRSVGVGE